MKLRIVLALLACTVCWAAAAGGARAQSADKGGTAKGAAAPEAAAPSDAKEPADTDPYALTGQPAPALELPRLDGETFRLADAHEDRFVVLDFWTTWCPWCRTAAKEFEALRKDFAEEPVGFYLVSVREEAETVERFVAREELEGDVVLDPEGDVISKYRVDNIPHVVIVDQTGTVRYVHIGQADMKQDVAKQLRELLAAASEEDTA